MCLKIQLAALALLAFTLAPAKADEGPFSLGSHTLSGSATASGSFTATSSDPTVGFTFSVNYVEHAPSGTWCSDLRLLLTSPNSITYSVGGYDNASSSDGLWVFQGGGSAPTGTYTDTTNQLTAFSPGTTTAGLWSWQIVNDYSGAGATQYNNVSLTLITAPIPEPTGMALIASIGAFGFVRFRRRHVRA